MVDQVKLDNQLMLDEGLRLTRYRDSRGFDTIGVGHNLTAAPLTPSQIAVCGSDGMTGPITYAGAIQVLHDDESIAFDHLDAHCGWWNSLDEIRARVMADLMFNMGWGTLSEFTRFLLNMNAHNFENAAADLEQSAWYKEVGNRGPRLVGMVRTGEDYTA